MPWRFSPPAGIIWIDINTDPDAGRSHCNIRPFAHELAHVLGFFHTFNGFNITIAGDETAPGDITFHPLLQYHARLAYEIGPGRPYCGWPYGPSCAADE